MTDALSAANAPDPLVTEFSPDLVRRLMEPVAPLLLRTLMRRGQIMRASQFAQFPPPDGQVVLLGDSITELGLWQEWFVGKPVVNRGIGGESSADLLRRLETAIGRPTAVFLLIGTNDLTLGVTLQEIVGNVRTLLAEVERRAPGTPVVVQSVMPRTRRYRDDARLLNRAYEALVAAAGDNVEYLDLWPALADEQGELRKAFTEDRLHLNGPGYAAWLDVLRPHVERFLAGATALGS
jgi:lysophospholipase L1-like esterase